MSRFNPNVADTMIDAFPKDDAVSLARVLIGATLLVDGIGGVIVETEAYDQNDPASHAFPGKTNRNQAMFGPAGTIYVYRSYGVHWCFNIAAGPYGYGAGVLIRALEPLYGLEIMAERRRMGDPRLLCAGPGRVAQALGITLAHNGTSVDTPPFALFPANNSPDVIHGPRIGISKAMEKPWRFGFAGSPFLSRPFAARESGKTGKQKPDSTLENL